MQPPVPPQERVLGVQEVTCWLERVGSFPVLMAAYPAQSELAAAALVAPPAAKPAMPTEGTVTFRGVHIIRHDDQRLEA